MEREEVEALAEEIRGLGYDEDTAGHYAALIGDRPIMSHDGKGIIVFEAGGKETDIGPLRFFGMKGKQIRTSKAAKSPKP